MEAPATAPPLSSAVSPPAPPHHLNYPDSVDSSPRSRNTDSWDEPYPLSAAAAAAIVNKLRLMCSFGGHIVPRPHDKHLCYVGGETRIVVVERHISLSDLTSRLSKTFLNDRSFALKYLLPCEDLDSLISVTTDEDLDNMIEEYDRISNSSVKPSRIRFFLFPLKPDSAQSIPIINSSAKSEDWFLGMLNRGLSDSGSVNLLMGFDDEVVAGDLDAGSKDVDAATSGSFGNGKGVKQQGQDVHSVPDSPMMETSSSFGSTSSSPSVANLPPIRVHVDDGSSGGARVQDQKTMGIEDQFAQMGVSGAQKQDEGFALSSPPTVPASAVSAVPISPSVVSGEYQNRVVSDDERSDHGVPVGYRKPPTQQPQTQPQPQPQILPTQFQQKTTGGLDLPSPDSVSSDNSFASAMSRPKPVVYQDQVQVQIPSGTTRVPSNPVDPKFNMSDSHGRIQMHQQVLDQGYVLQQQFDHQQHQQQQQFDHQKHQQQQQFDQHQQQQLFDHQQHQQQQQFDQQQQQHQQQQFDQQQQQHHQQQQFDQQQQQHHQQQQFDQQQQQHQQQQQFIHGTQQHVQESGYVLQSQFDQQQQQQQPQFIHGTQQQVQESGYVLQSQFDQQQQKQQQFIHGTHFVHHTPSGAVPMQSYFPVYPSQQQQQLHPQLHHQLEPQQYQYYILPARQTQAYNLSSQAQQPNINEPATTIPSSRAQATPNPAIVKQSSAYNPVRNAAVPKSEMNAGAYRTAVAGTPQLVQVHSGQPQQQFVAYSQYHHPSQSVAPSSAAPASYAYEYTDPAHSQIYYSQPLPPTMPSQYQTMAGGAAAGLPDASAQPPSDSMKQQTRTS